MIQDQARTHRQANIHQARVYIAQARVTAHRAWSFTLLQWAANCRQRAGADAPLPQSEALRSISAAAKASRECPPYRHPQHQSLNWSGRGKKPAWVEQWEGEGGTLEQLLVSANAALVNATTLARAAPSTARPTKHNEQLDLFSDMARYAA